MEGRLLNKPDQPSSIGPLVPLGQDNGIVLATWPRLLTVEMAALYLGIRPKTIRNHRYQLPGLRKWGGERGKIVFDRYVIDRWLDRCGGRRCLWLDAERLAG